MSGCCGVLVGSSRVVVVGGGAGRVHFHRWWGWQGFFVVRGVARPCCIAIVAVVVVGLVVTIFQQVFSNRPTGPINLRQDVGKAGSLPNVWFQTRSRLHARLHHGGQMSSPLFHQFFQGIGKQFGRNGRIVSIQGTAGRRVKGRGNANAARRGQVLIVVVVVIGMLHAVRAQGQFVLQHRIVFHQQVMRHHGLTFQASGIRPIFHIHHVHIAVVVIVIRSTLRMILCQLLR
mmetsp:Transcript_8149/g.20331  ORF Transcript_8149/g.20331 Transcript_8149/m.20331 type:complete len:231 (+) Transcript_8149:514-1206(+)